MDAFRHFSIIMDIRRPSVYQSMTKWYMGFRPKNRIIKEGDIVSLDAGVIYKGYHSDAARTHAVGEISKEAADLIKVTRESFFEGIKFAREGMHLFEISAAIGRYAEERGYGVVRELCGHGIGTHLHESPEIPNFAQEEEDRNCALE